LGSADASIATVEESPARVESQLSALATAVRALHSLLIITTIMLWAAAGVTLTHDPRDIAANLYVQRETNSTIIHGYFNRREGANSSL
jgi:hypothetical protein